MTNLIINANGKCLEISDANTFNGEIAQQWTCLGQLGSGWFLNFLPPAG